MIIYISSHDQQAARQLRALIRPLGHVVNSRWLDIPAYTGIPQDDQEKSRVAEDNLKDVCMADLLIVRAEPDGSFVPGGKHVETGAAIALGKPVIVFGNPENVFHWHPLVMLAADHETLVEHIRLVAANAERADTK